MSSFVCPGCKTTHSVFGSAAHFEKLSKNTEVDVLGQIPLQISICQAGDAGKPVLGPDDPFAQIAEKCTVALNCE